MSFSGGFEKVASWSKLKRLKETLDHNHRMGFHQLPRRTYVGFGADLKKAEKLGLKHYAAPENSKVYKQMSLKKLNKVLKALRDKGTSVTKALRSRR